MPAREKRGCGAHLVLDLLPRYTLSLILFLLLTEDVGVELLLQHLVCEVDAELLEGVGIERLETYVRMDR